MSDDQRNQEPRGLVRVMRKGVLVPLVALIAVLGLLTVILAGRSTKTPLPGGASKSAPADGLAGFRVTPVEPAPGLSLRDYRGKLVNLSAYRGKAVLVTFLYTHCPDVCPLITSNLRVAQAKLGAEASKLQIVAVSVDPHGDTPPRRRGVPEGARDDRPHGVPARRRGHAARHRLEGVEGRLCSAIPRTRSSSPTRRSSTGSAPAGSSAPSTRPTSTPGTSCTTSPSSPPRRCFADTLSGPSSHSWRLAAWCSPRF